MARPIRVLVVEDNKGDVHLARARLRKENVTLFDVSSLKEIENLAKTYRPDVILCDLNLPDSHGTEVVHVVQGRYPNVPVIVWSGSYDPELARDAFQAGAEDFIVKNEENGGRIARSIFFALLRNQCRDKETRASISALNLLAVKAKGITRHASKT